jgi:hypothetical protein
VESYAWAVSVGYIGWSFAIEMTPEVFGLRGVNRKNSGKRLGPIPYKRMWRVKHPGIASAVIEPPPLHPTGISW